MDCSDIPKSYGRGRGYSPDVRAMGATSGLDSILLQPSESELTMECASFGGTVESHHQAASEAVDFLCFGPRLIEALSPRPMEFRWRVEESTRCRYIDRLPEWKSSRSHV
jgi:hypothetical protein